MMTTATNDHGGRVERAALDHVAGGGQGVEAAALTARPLAASTSGGAPLLQEAAASSRGATLDQGQGGRVERAAVAGRAARASTARPDSYCAHCGRRMSPGRHGRRLYCSNGCRQSAYKRRRRVERAAASTVEG
jgi:hypothetical protein